MNNADLIERLRRNPRGCVFELEHTVADALAAADKQIAELEAELLEQSRLLGMGGEREAGLLGKLEIVEHKLAVAREALRMIAGERQCPDLLMGNADIALEALAQIGEK